MHEIGECAERLVDVGAGIGAVDLVQVDVVGVEPAEALLALADDPAARVALHVGVGAHVAVDLGRQHDVVAAALDRLGDDRLRLTGRVHVGGVDEVDPGVERGVHDVDRLVVVGVAPRAEHHRPEAERADADPGPADHAVFHRRLLRPRSRRRYPRPRFDPTLVRPPDGGRCIGHTGVVEPLRTAARPSAFVVVAVGGAAVYSWIAAGFRPFTTTEDVLVAIPAIAVLVLACRPSPASSPPIFDQPARRASRGSVAVWIALVVLATVWELTALFSSPRADHPTLSVIADDIMSVHPGRALMFLLWLALGWVLVKRPRTARP